MSGNLPKLSELPFQLEIERSGGKLYSVGGSVRDYLLGRKSKDLDILVTGIPMDYLELILAAFGRVDAVGKSFGVLKFKNDFIKEIDITIPRTERPNGNGGYQGFDVVSYHTLPIEKDLERRDFTINAIARDIDGNLIDPYCGVSDIRNKKIRMVNLEAFSDDPLRMLRAVQFASRFDFEIAKDTFDSIKKNAKRIQEISAERILMELEKIVKKGNCAIGSRLLYETTLLQHITREHQLHMNMFPFESDWNRIETLGEFVFSLTYQQVNYPARFFRETLKGDVETYREIKAYEIAYEGYSNDNPYKKRVFEMYKMYPDAINSKILQDEIKDEILYMKSKNMPFSTKELKINGDDLLQLGYVGKEIGDLVMQMIDNIYGGLLTNKRDVLLEYASLCRRKKQLT